MYKNFYNSIQHQSKKTRQSTYFKKNIQMINKYIKKYGRALLTNKMHTEL